MSSEQVECPTCNGTGVVVNEAGATVECYECDGAGSVEADTEPESIAGRIDDPCDCSTHRRSAAQGLPPRP